MSTWYFNDSHRWFLPIIGSLSGAFLSGLVAIFIFIVGKSIDKNKERKKVIKRIEEVQNLLEVQISAIQAPLKLQVRSICNFLNRLNSDKYQDLSLQIVTNYTPNELLFIKKDELYKVLVQEREGSIKDKNLFFFDYRNSILFLSESKSAIKSWASDLNAQYISYVNKFNEHSHRLMKSIDIIGTAVESKKTKIGDDKFLDAIEQVLDSFYSIKDRKDIHIVQENFILPINRVCQNKSLVYGDLRVNQILPEVQSAMFYFENYNYIRKTYYNLFLDLIRKIKANNKVLRKSYSALISYKIMK